MICVIGVPSSGTSAVAGVLYHLGIFMGDELLPASVANPKGYFEDVEFVRLHERMISNWKRPLVNNCCRQEYAALVRKREDMHVDWGVKDPRLCFLFPILLEIVGSAKVIFTARNVIASTRSLSWRDGMPISEAEAIIDRYIKARDAIVNGFEGEYLVVGFESLVEDAEAVVGEIAEFVGRPVVQSAVEFIDPGLRRF
jgi:hypothetical protein